MVLGQLQSLLSDIYALEVSYDVYDFLITDARLADELDAGGRYVDEKLLIAEEADARIGLSLSRTGPDGPAPG